MSLSAKNTLVVVPPADSAPTGNSSPGPSVRSGSACALLGRLPTSPRCTMCRCATGPLCVARIVSSFAKWTSVSRGTRNASAASVIRLNGA